MSKEQDKRCKAVLNDADNLVGDNSYETIDVIMSENDVNVRKIICHIHNQLCNLRENLEKMAQAMLFEKVVKENGKCKGLTELKARIEKLERGFRLLCEKEEDEE